MLKFSSHFFNFAHLYQNLPIVQDNFLLMISMIGMHAAITINVVTILIPISFLIMSVGIDTILDNTIRIILFKGSCTHMIIKLFRPKYAKHRPPVS